ncbi:hypothetical protein BC834DRAFT_345472 [Gloeopeniophorella convolvens]|nr:hypothetical protein BC834DRAFT_345472 [Gloeopeniophorella convolvens]
MRDSTGRTTKHAKIPRSPSGDQYQWWQPVALARGAFLPPARLPDSPVGGGARVPRRGASSPCANGARRALSGGLAVGLRPVAGTDIERRQEPTRPRDRSPRSGIILVRRLRLEPASIRFRLAWCCHQSEPSVGARSDCGRCRLLRPRYIPPKAAPVFALLFCFAVRHDARTHTRIW